MSTSRRLTVDNGTIEYKVVRSNRRKTSELFVDSKSVLIRTPAQKSAKDVERIIKAKVSWIAKKQEQYRQFASCSTSLTFEDGSILPFLGRIYPLYLVRDNKFKEEKIRLTNNQFLVSLKRDTKNQKVKVRKLYNGWLQQRAEAILEQKVPHFARRVDVSPRRIIVKDMRNRWGSATKTGILNFNQNLIKAPESIVDYIVVHELCHLKVRDHSQNFWKIVKHMMPDYRQSVRWLNSNANGLIE